MAMRLPSPMLNPVRAYPDGRLRLRAQVRGFRAIVARCDRFGVVSRRGWEMTALLPELGDLPAYVFEGEIVEGGERP